MASFKYAGFLQHNDSTAFDALLAPGTIAHNSGIYRCGACGDEIAANKNNPLPPQNHHQHAPGVGPIRWQLIVFAVQRN
ncbi:hypothetical protein FPZ22_12990 [Luteimonas granuli]|uniref:Protein L n=1 Tax=Luteimonas granuli TaxID=1176533 RepID=A0A518N6Y5_9GAMM|nr:hypothetical protein FPZ22_12990 [Luteimonas granuli]